MNEILLLCLMVLVVIGTTSGRWTRKSEEDPKDLKDEKENMKEYISKKIYTTTTSTSTMPPTTSTSKMPEIKDEMKELKEDLLKGFSLMNMERMTCISLDVKDLSSCTIVKIAKCHVPDKPMLPFPQ